MREKWSPKMSKVPDLDLVAAGEEDQDVPRGAGAVPGTARGGYAERGDGVS